MPPQPGIAPTPMTVSEESTMRLNADVTEIETAAIEVGDAVRAIG